MRSLSDDEIFKIHKVLQRVIQGKYFKRCRALGWSKRDIVEWADEVSGEGIALALKELDKWDPERGNISVWFYLKANTQARDELRKEAALKRQGYDLTAEVPEKSYEPFQSWDMLQALCCLLEDLSPVQREVLVLYEYVGLNGGEIGGLLGLPPKTVYTHLDRSKKKVRRSKDARSPPWPFPLEAKFPERLPPVRGYDL